MRRVFLSTILVPFGLVPFGLVGLALPAAAACVNALPSVTCSGPSSGFTLNSDYNGLAIVVNEGAEVTRSSNDSIRVRGTGNSVVNHGTIRGTGIVDADGEGGTDGIDGGRNLTVTNHGTITGTNKGVDAEDRDGLTVYNHGTISAYDKGIRSKSGANTRVENHGLIESETHEGIEAGNNAYILNGVGASIIASDDAINVAENATIVNYGLIHSVRRNNGDETDPQDAIDLDSGSITNHATGVILSDDDAAIDYDASDITSHVVNYGLISGTTGILVEKGSATEAPNLAAQIVTNHGVIEGRNGLALDLGAGDDVLNLMTGGSLIGGADFGTGNDRLFLNGDFFGSIAGGAWLDGGEGDDLVTFESLLLADLTRAIFGSDDQSVSLSFLTAASDFTINLVNWNSFTFADGATYSYGELQAVAPVPLPATALLLVGGLAGLATLRRRRKA